MVLFLMRTNWSGTELTEFFRHNCMAFIEAETNNRDHKVVHAEK